MAVNQEKEKAIELAMSAVERQFGKGSIMRLGNDEPLMRDVQAIPTGSISLDIALGVGGVPKGRIIEIFGPESSGKTTLCLHIVAEAQKRGGICGYVDAEHALDVGYARKLGVRTDDLLLSQPDTGEQALEIAEMLVRSGAIDVLVVDSVAALVPKAELEGEMGDAHMGVQARLMSQALRKLTGTIAKSQTCVIFINQIRMKIGVMFGNPETTTAAPPADGHHRQEPDVRHLHQPDPHEDWRDVRQPGDHDGRQRAEVLRVPAPGHPPHRRHQEWRQRGGQPHPREGGEEQGRAAVQGSRVRHHVRHGHLP
ncbi:recombinase RecA [Corallococcus macrosporus]|uniref:recombinase RecA n=1 Tax=Corallococcus macrosporus TaxID=35 RepID=UPI00031E66BE